MKSGGKDHRRKDGHQQIPALARGYNRTPFLRGASLAVVDEALHRSCV
jgi:hypothetical protein